MGWHDWHNWNDWRSWDLLGQEHPFRHDSLDVGTTDAASTHRNTVVGSAPVAKKKAVMMTALYDSRVGFSLNNEDHAHGHGHGQSVAAVPADELR